MDMAFPILIVVALGAVAVVLVMGIGSLVRGGTDRRRSNRLMQWRVALQAVALLLILIAVSLSRA